jgi:hypothetical protein
VWIRGREALSKKDNKGEKTRKMNEQKKVKEMGWMMMLPVEEKKDKKKNI